MNEKKPPAHKISFGRLTVSIWLNESREGQWYSLRLDRTYKEGDQWKQAQTLGRDDLLPASLLLQRAYEWVMAQKPGAA